MEVHVGASKEEIQFQALTDGLGFHPFADGLPYAPLVKTPRPEKPFVKMGTGAEAAGRPMIAIRQPVRAIVEEPAVLLEVEENFGFLYLFKRSLAFTLDSVLHTGLGIAALSAGLWRQGVNPGMLLNSGILVVAIVFLGFFNWALITAQEIAIGATIGKKILGLHIEGETSTIFIRALLFIPSLLFCGIGLFWAFWDPNRRCWHDVASGVQPREVARL